MDSIQVSMDAKKYLKDVMGMIKIQDIVLVALMGLAIKKENALTRIVSINH